MAPHAILVLLGDDPPAAARTHLAARLAVHLGAHVTGLAPTGRPHLDGSASAAHALETAEAARTGGWVRAQQLADRFRSAAGAEGVVSVDAVAAGGPTLPLLLHHAGCHGLVVVSAPPQGDTTRRGGVHFLEQVLAANPRPTLVVPGDGRFDHAGRRVVFAWDDSPAAVRAATDALTVLRRGSAVWLCAWRRAGDAAEDAVAARLHEVAAWLGRHGVVADCRVAQARGGVGDALLHDAAALGADLVVMGTYGHAKWIERVTGGATRTVLRHATLPLWMSH